MASNFQRETQKFLLYNFKGFSTFSTFFSSLNFLIEFDFLKSFYYNKDRRQKIKDKKTKLNVEERIPK